MTKTKKTGALREVILHNAPLRRLWLGQTISYMGDAIYSIALMWFVFQQTGSAIQVGLILVAGFLPEVLFGMFIGALVDRYNRKLLMQVGDLIRALLLGLFAVSFAFGSFSLWQLYVITIGLSLADLLFGTARSAWVPDLVEPAHLITANSLFNSSRQTTRLLGSAVGGIMVAWMGATWAIAFDALTFVISWLFIQVIPYQHHPRDSRSGKTNTSLFTEIGEGLRWLRNYRVLLLLILIGTLSNIALGPTNVLPAMLIKADLQQEADALGIFDAAIAIGLLAGGLLVGALSPKRIGVWFIGGLALEGVGMLIVALAPNLVVACAGNALLGVAVMMSGIPLGTLVQKLTPSGMRGRVNSIMSIGFNMAIPITYGGIGLLAEVIGARASYAAGCALLLVCAAMGLASTQLRQSPTPSEHKTTQSF